MKVKTIFSVLLIITAGSCKKKDRLNDTDRKFLNQAAYGHYNEIDLGQLAASKAEDPSVKTFANMMVADHQAALTELQTLASDKEVTIPAGPDATHQSMKQQMQTMTGRTFDSTYIHGQVVDHRTTITLFEDEIKNGQNKDVMNYANAYLPGVQMHFNRADTTANRF